MSKVDLDAMRRIPFSSLTWIGRDEWLAILAALERAERVEKAALAAHRAYEQAIAVQDPDGFIAGDPWEGWIDAMEALRAVLTAAPGGGSK